jgi:hypothetical protein
MRTWPQWPALALPNKPDFLTSGCWFVLVLQPSLRLRTGCIHGPTTRRLQSPHLIFTLRLVFSPAITGPSVGVRATHQTGLG